MTTCRRRYKNARDLLSKKELKKLQRVHVGVLYVPGPKRITVKTRGIEQRNQRIRELHAQGKSIHEISKEVALCPERVRRVVKSKNNHYHMTRQK